MQLRLVLGVEASRRFIGEHHSRVVHQSPCHCHTLLLSARQFVGLMLGAVGESHEVQQFHATFLSLAFRHSRYEGRNHDILKRREFWQQLMKLEHEADVSVAEVGELLLVQSSHVHSVNHYLPAVRRVERTDYLEQCGLSRTARSHDAHHLSFVYMQVDALEHLQRAEALCDILYVDHCLL